MSTLLKINVVNNLPANQNIFIFQAPAIYSGGAQVYTNSLYMQQLAPANLGASLTFQANLQFYAGVQQAATQTPVVGQVSGYESAIQPIDLTSASNTPTNNATSMSLPLGLNSPTYETGVQAGAFRIITPVYNSVASYNAGSALSANGTTMLSSFVTAQPNQNIDCQPILKFYVATGSYTPGTVMNFTQSSATAGLCDFTGGYGQANVSLNQDGTWTVSMS